MRVVYPMVNNSVYFQTWGLKSCLSAEGGVFDSRLLALLVQMQNLPAHFLIAVRQFYGRVELDASSLLRHERDVGLRLVDPDPVNESERKNEEEAGFACACAPRTHVYVIN